MRIERSKYERIGRRAKLLALLGMVPLVFAFNVAIFVLLELVGYSGSNTFMSVFFGLYFIVWLMLAERIEQRLPERHRFQEPMELGEAKVESEVAQRVRQG